MGSREGGGPSSPRNPLRRETSHRGALVGVFFFAGLSGSTPLAPSRSKFRDTSSRIRSSLGGLDPEWPHRGSSASPLSSPLSSPVSPPSPPPPHPTTSQLLVPSPSKSAELVYRRVRLGDAASTADAASSQQERIFSVKHTPCTLSHFELALMSPSFACTQPRPSGTRS